MKSNVLNTISFFVLATVLPVKAEVRLNQYLFISKTSPKENYRASITTSSNTPIGQESHTNKEKENSFLILRTWMCKGVTGPNHKCAPKKVFKY